MSDIAFERAKLLMDVIASAAMHGNVASGIASKASAELAAIEAEARYKPEAAPVEADPEDAVDEDEDTDEEEEED